MRDIMLTMTVFSLIPFIFIRPYVGILAWTWLAFMSPQGLTWGFAYEMPFSKIIGIATLIAFVFYKDKIMPRSSAVLWLFFAYVAWSTVTTMYALNPEDATETWGMFMKIALMTTITMLMTNNKERLHALLAVVVFSVGFYAIKGGIFTIITAGNFRVWGPPLSSIEDNNALGLALVMLLPLMKYLHSYYSGKWMKRFMVVVMVLTAFAIVGTHSRGAFLALVTMISFMVFKSRARFKVGFVVLLLAPLVYTFMPQGWHDRMETIKNYKQDESAMMRIKAWDFSVNLANEFPITGGGYDTYNEGLFSVYSKGYDDIPWTGPHSIYFETLGEHGWVGLIIYLLMGIALYRNMNYLMKYSRNYNDLKWMAEFAAMIQVSVVSFAVAGAFLELAKFDLYFVLIAFSVIMTTLLKNRMDEEPVIENKTTVKANTVGVGVRTGLKNA